MSSSIPTNARIALALIVLRSKPSGITVEEYLFQIRSIILNRPRRESVVSHNYIDATLFWKQAYERLELENGKLLDRIFELEDAQDQDHSISDQAQALPTRPPGTKNSNKANTQTKRRRIEQCSVHGAPDKDGKECIETIPHGCHVLLRLLFMVHTQASSKDPDPIQLCQVINTASHSAKTSLITLCQRRTATTKSLTSQPCIKESLRAIARLWLCLVTALDKIEQLKADGCDSCLPGLISLFQTLIGQIQQNCLDAADREIKACKRLKTKNRSYPRASAGQRGCTEKEEQQCLTITEACCGMLSALKVSSTAHCLLLEGIMCALFDHIGSAISLMIFVEPGMSMKKQTGILPPCGLIDVAHLDSDTALLTSQLAGPYLVPILKETLRLANNMDDERRCELLGSSRPTAELCNNVTDLFRQRLQNTLLRGVFGDEDATFKNALSRSLEPDEANWEQIRKSVVEEMDRSEWFIGQVWEHLGWDVLSAA